MHRALSCAVLFLAPMAATAGAPEYWSYAYRNVEVTAAGSSAYAMNLARYCVRLDGMLTRILAIKTSERPPVHIYALPPAQVRRLLGNQDQASFRRSPGGNIILTTNTRESDSEYWGVYFGYTAALLASDHRLGGPDWYIHGVPMVFASTRYRGTRAQLGTVSLGFALTLGQGSALIPMRRFLALGRASVSASADTLKVYDAEAWGLAHEVFVEGWHRAEFAKYLELMRQGSQESEAFAASFDITYEQLDKEFAYALRRRALAYTMDSPDPGGGAESAHPLSAEQVDAQLARLAALYTRKETESQ